MASTDGATIAWLEPSFGVGAEAGMIDAGDGSVGRGDAVSV
jgi:hypothetical protein